MSVFPRSNFLERGLRRPSLTTIFKLAERLEVPPGQFVMLGEDAR